MTLPRPADVAARLVAHRRLDLPAVPGRRNDHLTGVLVPIVWDPAPTIIATLRPRTLRNHGGEVCFPGGRAEPDDADLWATAVREAREELGLHTLERLGRLSSMPLYTSDYRIEPFVGVAAPGALTPDPAEVEAVFHLDPVGVYARETVEGIPYEFQGVRRLSPTFLLGDGVLMFGATAHIYWELLEVMAPLYGASMPQVVESALTWSDLLG